MLALTCGGDHVTDAGIDGGPPAVDAADARAPGLDARIDQDGSREDAGGPIDPEWTPLAVAEGCIEVARNPEGVLRELAMRSCGEGCREVDVNWAAPTQRRFRVEDVVPDPAGGAMLLFTRRVDQDEEHTQTLVAAADGRVLAAYRSPYTAIRGCFMGTIAVTSTHVILTLVRSTPDGDLHPPLVMAADLTAPWDVDLVHEFEGPVFLQWMDANESMIAVASPGEVARLTYEGDVTWLRGRFNALQGDAVFAHREVPGEGYQLVVLDDRGERVLHTVADTDAGALATDGHDMAWYQGSPVVGAWETSELWTSAYTTDPPVAGRRLFDADRRTSYPDFVVSEGHVIRTISPGGGLEIISLADGSEVDRIPREDDDSFAVSTHAYLRGNELGFGITRGNITPWNVTYRWVER